MKRIIAILLISILLFNWVGYQLYSTVMQHHAGNVLIANLDENKYSESELISIKVPAVHLSYYVNTKAFERVDGQIELNGIQYNYVKRRYVNDSLELLCIPNQKANELKTAREDFFKLVNDLQHPGQTKKSDQQAASFKCFNGEYFAEQNHFTLQTQTVVSLKAADRYLLQITSAHLSRTGQPPDLA